MKISTLVTVLLLLCTSLVYGYSFGQNKVNAVQTDWAYLQTLHFDIYYPSDQPEFGQTAALMAEESYYYIKENLKYPITSRIPVMFYSSKSEFQSTNIIYPLLTEGVGGFTESLLNRVVIPFEGSYAKLEELLTHELTHAYINALDKRITNAINALRPTSFPFWFSEGLPEYLSIGGEDAYNNMFILDMVLNDKIGKLENTDGYLAYRLGESFLVFIGKTYGREKVGEYFYAMRSVADVDDASKRIFGLEFEELEARWHFQLKRESYAMINQNSIPTESYEQRTKNVDDGSYFNIMPRFSPDGSRFVYYSDQKARYSIWMAGTHGLSPAKRILLGEATARHEEFYYFRSNLAWFPDSKRIAFVSKSAPGDRIHILDVDTGKVERSILIPQLSALYEIDVSPDGKQIVISAQAGMQSDLYLFDLESGETTQLTNDGFDDKQPRFSPDGLKIAYSSERQVNPPREGFFDGLVSNIFSYELSTGNILQHTFETSNCSKPGWDNTGTKLFYLGEADGINNLFLLDLATSQKGRLSNTLAGVYSGDLSPDNTALLLSIYFNNAWNIYYGNNPLQDIVWTASEQSKSPEVNDNISSLVPLQNLGYYAKKPKFKLPRIHSSVRHDPRRPFFSSLTFANEDSMRAKVDYSWDAKPDSLRAVPTPKKYKAKFHLDSFWGGFAYSSSAGAVGQLQLGLSDLMGNHGIGIDLGISGKIEDSNILLSYLYLKRRADYGVGIYNLFDEAYYRELTSNPEHDYFRVRQRETGIYLLFRYPLSRFLRLDFDQRFYNWEYHIDSWEWNPSYTEGTWVEDNYPLGWTYKPLKELVYAPGLTLVHDNALYGSTGPMVGWRGMYMIRKSFAPNQMDFFTNYLDLRSYSLFSKRYAFANRFIAALSTGKNPQRFDLGGYYGVRAYDGELSGEKKLMYSTELRFPFFDYINLAFPVPLGFTNIRGAAFVDLGAVWDKNKDFQPMHLDKFKDVHMGFGFGPRINLGYFVLKFDIAWETDLSNNSKPRYYLSLTEDF